ncbi:MAG TPA: hydrogenase, partial [Anaerolineae bacterium]|nr:hydrogenase [Anaerolineae bacterium]
MVTKILPAGNLSAWIDQLVATHEVFAPMEGEGASSFKQIKAGELPALDIRTDVPPKGLVFRQSEKVLSYVKDENGVVVEGAPKDETRKLIFGIRPCDSRSFELTDKVFVHSDMPEQTYAERRKQTALITLACNKASRTCFCTSVGGSPADKVGDVWMMNLGDRFLVEALSPVGEELLKTANGLLSDATADDETAAKRITDEVVSSMPTFNIPAAKA